LVDPVAEDTETDIDDLYGQAPYVKPSWRTELHGEALAVIEAVEARWETDRVRPNSRKLQRRMAELGVHREISTWNAYLRKLGT
jgi:hypothetical protein